MPEVFKPLTEQESKLGHLAISKPMQSPIYAHKFYGILLFFPVSVISVNKIELGARAPDFAAT